MIGRQLSHFRILDRIGEGGMGVVYRAEDEKLLRVVALKVLPPEKLADEERRLRFVREARTAAAVTHPNIAVVHEIDEADGVVFIAMELIEGKTLREAIGGKPMPLREALRLSVEIAEGLSAAHQAKVIHRDLKPDNVIVTAGGHVKILDFGLAKLLEERAAIDPEEASKLATVSDEMTQAGRVLGTAAYMSPEQARGLAVDARSDLFSFGIVLYEMVTGKAPFRGTTSMDTLTAILREQPVPAVQLNPEVPAELERIIGKCLEKESGERYQDARDLVVDLRRLKRDTESQPLRKAEITQPRTFWNRLPWMAAALVLVGVTIVAALKLAPRQEPKRELIQRQITANPPDNPVRYAQISPDGRSVAYSDRAGIQVRRIETGETHLLRFPAGFEPMAADWLPDGTGMLVTARESQGRPLALWELSLLGGAPRKILDEVNGSFLSPDGKHLAYSKSLPATEIWVSGPHGESPRLAIKSDHGGLYVTGWSPNSRRIAYLRVSLTPESASFSVESADLDGGPGEKILSSLSVQDIGGNGSPIWLPDGRFVYSLAEPPPNEPDINLWAVPVDPVTGAPNGTPRRVTSWVGAGAYFPSAPSDGRRLAVLKSRGQSDIYVADVEAGGQALTKPRRLTLDDRDDFGPIWTPDSRSVVFNSARGGTLDIFRQDVDTTSAEPVVAAPDQQIAVALTRDGSTVIYRDFKGSASFVAYTLAQPSDSSTMRAPLVGGPPDAVAKHGVAVVCPSTLGVACVTPEIQGAKLVVSAWDPSKGPGARLATFDAPAPSLGPARLALSPDGTRLAIAFQGTLWPIKIFDLADGRERNLSVGMDMLISGLAWSARGDALYASDTTNEGKTAIHRVTMGGRASVLLELDFLTPGALSLSPDGRRLAYVAYTTDSNVWLLENF